MLSEEKIKKMIRLAEYEKGQGSTDLKRVRYLRADYVRLKVHRAIASVIVAAFLILLLIAGYHTDFILQNALSMPLLPAGAWALGCTAAGCVAAAILTGRAAARQYDESAVRAGEYRATLQELLALYEREESGQEEQQL